MGKQTDSTDASSETYAPEGCTRSESDMESGRLDVSEPISATYRKVSEPTICLKGSCLVDAPAESRLRPSASLPPQLFVNSARAIGRPSLPSTAGEGGSSSHDMMEWRVTASTDCETCWR